MQHIETVTLDSAEASITFSSIPDTFTDLLIVVSARISGQPSIGISQRFNGSTADFSGRFLEGTGSGVSSYTTNNIIGYTSRSTDTANTFSSTSIYIPNYRSSVAKSVSVDSTTENNATAAFQLLGAVLWNNTAAITSIELYNSNSFDFVQYTSASLYGITAGSDGIVAVS